MSFEQLNNAGLKAIGLIPEWVHQPDHLNPPNSPSDGIYLQESPRSMIAVATRTNSAHRTARIVLDVIDLTTSVYTTVINGNSVVYDAAAELPATAADLISGIADKINADGTVSLIVVAAPDSNALETTIIIGGKALADFSFDFTIAGGTGTYSEITADASMLDVDLWFLMGGIVKSGSTGPENSWIQADDGNWQNVDYRGLVNRLDSAGIQRCYVRTENITGHAADGISVDLTISYVGVGPSVLEASS